MPFNFHHPVNFLKGLRISGTAVTSSAAELNILDGVTADKDELNILDSATATTADLSALHEKPVAATIALAAKAGNDITATVTLKDADGTACAGAVPYYIASDATGLTPVSTADTIAAGAKGKIVEFVSHAAGLAITAADGIVNITVTEATGSTNHYLVIVLPTGKLAVSAVMAF